MRPHGGTVRPRSPLLIRKHAALTCCVAYRPGGSDGYHIVEKASRARSKPERQRALGRAGVTHGTACVLEGLPQALPRLLPDRALSGRFGAERVAFNSVNKKTGNRLKQQTDRRRDRGRRRGGGQGPRLRIRQGRVPHDRGRGARRDRDREHHTIEIDSFVPRAEIDERFLDSPYYIAPNEPVGQEAFAVIREAMRGKDMVALGRVVLCQARARDHAAALGQGAARHDAALPLRGARPGRLFRGHSRPQAAGRDEAARRPHHRYQVRPLRSEEVRGPLRERPRRAVAQEAGGRALEPIKDEGPAPQRVINLMDALRASIGAEQQKKPAAASAKTRAPAAAGGKRKAGR